MSTSGSLLCNAKCEDCLRLSRPPADGSGCHSQLTCDSKQHRHLPYHPPMLTPPDETINPDWTMTATSAAVNNTSSARPQTSSNEVVSDNATFKTTGAPRDDEGDGSSRTPQESQDSDRSRPGKAMTGSGQAGDEYGECTPDRPWLEDALAVLGTPTVQLLLVRNSRANICAVSNSIMNSASENEVKVVCQTLPHPPRARPSGASEGSSASPHTSGGDPPYTPPTVIVSVTNAIQETYSRHGRRPFIQVHHAVESSMVNLEQLPSSPPLTGGACFSWSNPASPSYFAFGAPTMELGDGAGYFARTVFNTAVPVLPAIATNLTTPSDLDNYDAWAKKQETAPLPSPNPIVLPLSHQISVLERYIPPDSPHEDQKIFSNVSSTLVDRLFELSPNGGHLLFVYPTRTGAEAFAKAYLGPILEPLLRRLMSIHGMPESFCEALDKMRAIEFMKEFDELKAKIANICSRARADLGGQRPGSEPSDGSEERVGGIRLVYSRKATVHLKPDDWKEWWISQEASRIKKTISIYYEMGYKMPENMAPGDLERAIIDGIRPMWTPQLREGQGFKPQPKVAPVLTPPMEVGVFIMKRMG